MANLKSKIQELRGEYMAALNAFLEAKTDIEEERYKKEALKALDELRKITNNPLLIGLDVVKNNIPVKEVKK